MSPSHQHLISLRYCGQVWKPFDFLHRLKNHNNQPKAYDNTSKTQTPFQNSATQKPTPTPTETPEKKMKRAHRKKRRRPLLLLIKHYVPIIITRQKLCSSTTPPSPPPTTPSSHRSPNSPNYSESTTCIKFSQNILLETTKNRVLLTQPWRSKNASNSQFIILNLTELHHFTQMSLPRTKSTRRAQNQNPNRTSSRSSICHTHSTLTNPSTLHLNLHLPLRIKIQIQNIHQKPLTLPPFQNIILLRHNLFRTEDEDHLQTQAIQHNPYLISHLPSH